MHQNERGQAWGRSMTLNDSARTSSRAKHALNDEAEGTTSTKLAKCPGRSRGEKTRGRRRVRKKEGERGESERRREHNENEEHAWKPRLVDLNSGESISCLPTCLLACQPG